MNSKREEEKVGEEEEEFTCPRPRWPLDWLEEAETRIHPRVTHMFTEVGLLSKSCLLRRSDNLEEDVSPQKGQEIHFEWGEEEDLLSQGFRVEVPMSIGRETEKT